MLWSESREATSYYRSRNPVWSSFWLLDSTGRREFGANRFDEALVTLLLDYLS